MLEDVCQHTELTPPHLYPALLMCTMCPSNTQGDSDQYESGTVSPGTGPSLRTGRNAETYSDARALSANAKMEALRKKFPSNDSIHR